MKINSHSVNFEIWRIQGDTSKYFKKCNQFEYDIKIKVVA